MTDKIEKAAGGSDPEAPTDGTGFERLSGGNGVLVMPPTLEGLLEKVPEEARPLIEQAYRFAERMHEGQKRKSGDPYIHHPLAVAHLLADFKMDAPSIAAGLLHDVVEDTGISNDEMKKLFPDPVPEIVRGITKIGKINFQTTGDQQMENLRIMFLAMAQDVRVVIVKLCDRLHNMQTMKFMSADKQRRISQETLDIYAPLANRLGMSRMRVELEDLAMRWLHPETYRELTRKISRKKGERELLVKEAIEILGAHLSENFEHLSITGRTKHFYSIYKKMTEQNLTFEQIYDLNAIRILCDYVTDCYEILGHVHAFWKPVPGRFKDYIATPKKNKYQSLHTTVVGHKGAITEIQIRTRRMHQVAELGIAAHWKYKEVGSEIQDDERVSWIRHMAEWITDPNEPEGLLDALKKDVFADHVFCFSPKGDIIELPAKATPIDFAYAIHTKIGETCVGAKINGRMLNLRTHLHHGDVVEIVTAKNGHPSRDWLGYVRTGRARQKIKHWLKARNLDEWIDQGRSALASVLKERGHEVSGNDLEAEMKKLLPAYKLETVSDLYVEIGFKSISAAAALARMNPEWAKSVKTAKRDKAAAEARKNAPHPKRQNRRSPKEGVQVEGADGAPKKIASCCMPIPGDEIVGFVTRGRGITIHKKHCRGIQRYRRDEQESGRILRAFWTTSETSSYAVRLHVVAEDRDGLLNSISGIISSHGLSINSSDTRTDKGRGVATLGFEVGVHDVDHLEKVLTALRGESGVISADRRRASASGED